MEKSKFLIYNHVYISKTLKGKILLYDTKTGNRYETTLPVASEIINEIYRPENLGVVDVSDEYLENKEGRDFFDMVVKMDLGKLLKIEPGIPRIINLLPILNLQDDVDKIRKDPELKIGENSLRYLNELNIYLNSECKLNCWYCHLYYKETKCCFKYSGNKNLAINDIKTVFDDLANASILRINFLGGNVLTYPYFDDLITLLKKYEFDYHFWIHIENAFYKLSLTDFYHDIIINHPVNKSVIGHFIKKNKQNEAITYHFFVENEEQCISAENLIETEAIINFKITPIYTGDNLSFFEENIYLTKEDIFAKVIPFQEIFRNQKLNANNFGKLYIFPNGIVQANPNTKIIGNIATESLLEIIKKELIMNTSWRKIRDEKPCSECLYQYLCPAPSGYEAIIGKLNLCKL